MIRLTKHAQEAIAKRAILVAWIEDAVSTPDFVQSDPRHLQRTRSYKTIAQFGGRVLRVVHCPEGNDIVVITAHFDRGAKP
jgi:hypothetical protein